MIVGRKLLTVVSLSSTLQFSPYFREKASAGDFAMKDTKELFVDMD